MTESKKESPRGKMLGVRVSENFLKALNKSKWLLEKESSQIVREAITEYWIKHLSQKDLRIIKELLGQSPETTLLEEKESSSL